MFLDGHALLSGESRAVGVSRTHYHLRELGTRLRSLSEGATCPGRILIVDEEGGHYGEPLAAAMPECRFTIEPCPGEAKRHFLSAPIDLVILSHTPDLSCLDLLPAFKALRPSVSVIITTDCGSEELAVQTFRHGAIDYFRKPFSVEEMELSIRAILEIRRRFWESGKPLPVSGLQRALRYMETNFHGAIRLDDAAREAGMSVSCFERYLKSQTGVTFTTYLNSLRIAKARDLLQTTSASMLQIALACGFDNQSHFNRVFKRIVGRTPGECRKAALPEPRKS